MQEGGPMEITEAKRASAAVLHALRDRLTPTEAAQAAAQLPRPLQFVWRYGEAKGRRPVRMHRKEFFERVRGEAGLDSWRDARDLTSAVFHALKLTLTPGEGEDIVAQLPTDLKTLWVEALHATDFSSASRAAFTKAVQLCKKNRSELVIAHVLAPVLPPVDGYMTPQLYTELEEAGRRSGKKNHDARVAKARKAGVRARGLLLDGLVHERIVRAARSQGAEMIVIGTHGRTGFARFVLGSVASRVVSHAKCPVLTVQGR
jgi:uncharacterized protein (DUF2267 family)